MGSKSAGGETERVRILDRTRLSDFFSRVWRVRFSLRQRGGGWRTLTHEVCDHGDAAAVLPVDHERRTALLARQFRLPAHVNGGDGFLLEACAGIINPDEAPEACARREALEEMGYEISGLVPAGSVYASPGSLTERLYLFLAAYDPSTRRHDGGGVDGEGEDIETIEMPLAELAAMAEHNAIADAKTLCLVNALRLKHPELFC